LNFSRTSRRGKVINIIGAEMTSERWRNIEEIYHSALQCEPALRAAFLAKACKDDDELRREVESLLAQPSGDGILARPAWRDAETVLDSTATQIVPGIQLGPFRIEAPLGAGGMGEVFRARDTRLGRSVAIKTSHERFSDRFEREARAISALNHPHICTLYDIGPDYLVMELVEGETLAARLKRGKLSLEETFRYATQTAQALAEAHAHAIIHRDLKPSNIMLTRHGVKVLDFGLAKMLSEPGVTETRAVMGTPAYMAPEQTEGREPSSATDLFSFGLVLYEMAAGKLPFPGASLAQMLSTGSNAAIPPPSEQRAELPAELDELVAKLLRKDPAQRAQSASEVAGQLAALADRLAAPPLRPRLRPMLAVGAIAMIFLLAGGSWLYRRMEQRRWVREEAIPQLTKLAAQEPLAAFLLLRKAEQILPGDPQLAGIVKSATQLTSVESTPAGAKVEIQDYLSPGDWFSLGTTPLKNVRIPVGYFRWKISKPGEKEFVAAPPTADAMKFTLPSADRDAGMVPVAGGMWGALVDFLGWLVYDLPPYDIDRFEVTNAQYQEFVDQGGYRKPEYWKEKFVKDGKEMTWGQAMDLFRDPTGRPGPSTWEAGHFPQGQAEYPVSGVSWYEAAAYAAFVGKSLPAIGQWFKAAPADLAPFSVNQSNFGGRGPVQVGTLGGVGPYGTYDMAGNVREWSLTAIDDGRFILGGAWRTQTYAAMDPEVLPPFDRSPLNGFRTVRNHGVLSAAAAAPLVTRGRDFSKAKPVSDDVFQAYKTMYAYDRTPLNAKTEGIVEDTAVWTKEKIAIDAGYEGQRLPIYLFLPKNVHPPFQTVLFFPSARVELMTHSQNLGDMDFVDYVIKSGRALLYPIYQGTYERRAPKQARPGDIEDLQLVIQQSKEVRRSVDYLATRPEIDASKLAYLGVSVGTAYGVIFTALEDRFRTLVFLDGGFFLGPARRGRDQADFAPRVTKPVLMVNGKYDSSFSPQRSQEPLLRMLGTPEGDKLRVVLDTPHDVSQQKDALSKEVLAWLDKYLGRVN
jgi:eukaryotic-like serine/threonine-protein kinase